MYFFVVVVLLRGEAEEKFCFHLSIRCTVLRCSSYRFPLDAACLRPSVRPSVLVFAVRVFSSGRTENGATIWHSPDVYGTGSRVKEKTKLLGNCQNKRSLIWSDLFRQDAENEIAYDRTILPLETRKEDGF